MISVYYLLVMSGVVILIAALSIPSLFWPKCATCRRRNWVAKDTCAFCGSPLVDDMDV